MPPVAAVAVAVFAGASAVAAVATALGFTITVFGVSLATIATVGLAVSALVAAATMMSAFKKPASQESGQLLSIKLDPHAAVPVVYGRTATAGFGVYKKTGGGTKNPYLYAATVLSIGPITDIESARFDDLTLTFASSPKTGMRAVTGTIPSDAQSKTFKNSKLYHHWNLGPKTNTSIGARTGMAGPQMTGNTRFDGLAHTYSRFEYNTDAFPSGEPRKQVYVIKGRPLWDPRLDSTYPGGSGPQRRDDESTWVYSNNPYLAALDWVLGYTTVVAGKTRLVYGIGAPRSTVDIGAFVAAANIADANQWTLGGQVTSDDDKYACLRAILQAGGGVPVTSAGRISVLVNSPKTAVFAITDDDIIGNVETTPTTSFREGKNTIIGQYQEENTNWETVPTDEVTVADYVTADGGEIRATEVVFGMVQNARQAKQLATYELVNLREALTVKLLGRPRLLNVRVGEAITLTHGTQHTARKMVVMSRDFEPSNLTVALTLRAESETRHAFALGQTQVAPAVPELNGFDPSAPEAPGANAWAITATQITNASGVSLPAIVIDGANDDPNTAAIKVEFRVQGGDWVEYSIGSNSSTRFEISGLTDGTAYEAAISYRTVRGYWTPRRILGPVNAGVTVSGGVRPGGIVWNPTANTSPIVGVPPVLTTIDGLGRFPSNAVTVGNTTLTTAFANLSGVLANAIDAASGTFTASDQYVAQAATARDQAVQSASNALANAIASANSAAWAQSNATLTQTRAGYAGANATTAQTQASYASANATLALTNRNLTVSYAGQATTSANVAAQQAAYATANASIAQSNAVLATGFAGAAQANASLAATQLTYATSNAAGADAQRTLAVGYAGQALTNATISSTQAGYATANATLANTQRGLAVTYAGQAQANASVARQQATYAGANAATAQAQAGLAATYSGQAGSNAASAAAQALIATQQAGYAAANSASAAQSATLAANVGTASMNDNATFAQAVVGSPPTSWVSWNNGNVSAIQPGQVSDKAIRFVSATDTDCGIRQFVRRKSGPGWFVLEATVTLVSGKLEGAGVLVQAHDNANASTGGSATIAFSTDQDISGTVQGDGVAGRTYTFTKLIRITDANFTTALLYAMTNWVGTGARRAKTLDWHYCALREADAGEIETGQARAGFASVSARINDVATVAATATSAVATRATTLETLAKTIPNKLINSDGSQGQRGWETTGFTTHFDPNVGAFFHCALSGTNYHVSQMMQVGPNSPYRASFEGDGGSNPGDAGVYFSEFDVNGTYIGSRDGQGHTNFVGAGWFVRKANPAWTTGPDTHFIKAVIHKGASTSYVNASRIMVTPGTEIIGWSDEATVRDVAARVTLTESVASGADGKVNAKVGFTLQAGNLISGMSSQNDGTIATTDFLANVFRVWSPGENSGIAPFEIRDGSVRAKSAFIDRLRVGATMTVGTAQLKVQVQPFDFNITDGQVVNFGYDLGYNPTLTFAGNNLAPLNSGETYNLYAEGLTPTGFTARLKINTPATPSNLNTSLTNYNPNGPTTHHVYIDGYGGRSTTGGYDVRVTGINRVYKNRFGQNPNPNFPEYQYDDPDTQIEGETWITVYGWNGGAWVELDSIWIGPMWSTGNGYSNQSYDVTQTVSTGTNISHIGVAIAYKTFNESYIGQLGVSWQTQGSGGGIRSATPNGQVTSVNVRPRT